MSFTLIDYFDLSNGGGVSNYVVAAAMGQVGSVVAGELLSRGATVTVIVRTEQARSDRTKRDGFTSTTDRRACWRWSSGAARGRCRRDDGAFGKPLIVPPSDRMLMGATTIEETIGQVHDS